MFEINSALDGGQCSSDKSQGKFQNKSEFTGEEKNRVILHE
jgi:hypothetical protein